MTVPATTSAIAAGLSESGLPFVDASLAPMPRIMDRVLGRRASAITLGATIFVGPDRFDRVVDGDDAELLAHELIHVAQWQRDGVVRFVARYLTEYLRLRGWGLGHDAAYRHIGYEWAAYSGSRHIVQHL